MREYQDRHGLQDRKALTDYAFSLTSHYGSAAAALACKMYDRTARASGVIVPAAEPAEAPEYGEVAKAVNGTLKRSPAGNLTPDAVGRLVKRTGADTTLLNARRDHAQFAWVPHGDSCPFCIMIASRGWQYMSRAALNGSHAEHIHANCDCEYAIRFDTETVVEGYDPEEYKEKWDGAEGNTTAEKLNYMRRQKTGQMQFQTEEQLEGHYNKHGQEFGDISKEEYLARANALLRKETSENIMEIQRQDNSTSRYDSINNEFLVINEDNTIRTFFKPASGEEYWKYEKQRNQ